MTSGPRPNRQRMLAFVAVFLLLVSGGMFGTIFYLQSRITKPNVGPRTSFVAGGTPILSQSERETIVAKARLLRNRWRVWALHHVEAIKQVQSAPEDNEQAASSLYDILPASPKAEDAGLSLTDLSAGPFRFTWNASTKAHSVPAALTSDPRAQRFMSNEKLYAVQRLRDGFLTYRDVEVATSVNFGSVHYTLWVSGRITEDSDPTPDEIAARKLASRPKGWSRREIESPYDFLR